MLSSVKPAPVTALCQIYYLFSAPYEVQIDFHFLRRNLDLEYPLRFPKTDQATGNRCNPLSVCSRRTKVMFASDRRWNCLTSAVSTVLLAFSLVALFGVSGLCQDEAPPATTTTQQGTATTSQQNEPATSDAEAKQGQVQVLTPLPQAPAPQRNAHPYSSQDWSRGQRQWPNPFVIYAPRTVPTVNVKNSPGVDQTLKDGKIYLSLSDAIA